MCIWFLGYVTCVGISLRRKKHISLMKMILTTTIQSITDLKVVAEVVLLVDQEEVVAGHLEVSVAGVVDIPVVVEAVADSKTHSKHHEISKNLIYLRYLCLHAPVDFGK